MRILIDPAITKATFFAQGHEIPKVIGGKLRRKNEEVPVHVFRHPRLLTNTAAIGRLPSSQRDMIARLLEFHRRVVEYDDVSVEWSDIEYPGVWGPSIDTILFAKALHGLLRLPGYRVGVRSFLEIGCGSGFLSKYVIQKKKALGKPLGHAHLMDINPDALTCAMRAIEETRGNTLVTYTLNKSEKPLKVAHGYDLVVCNPPYVPRPHEQHTNPFEGLFLYGEILRKAEDLLSPGGTLITNFSSISRRDVYPEFRKKFTMRTLVKMKVPLKIPLITAQRSDESKKWMEYLLRTKRLFVDRSEKSGYRYWHTIEIVECIVKK
jgi:methylase of polypeptide subunit release factors